MRVPETTLVTSRPIVAEEPPTRAPAPAERVRPFWEVRVVVATEVRALVPLPYRSWEEVKVPTPVPPLPTATVPVTFVAVPPILRDEVETWRKAFPAALV